MAERFTVEPADGRYSIRAGGAVLAETTKALILREEGYDPVVYFPRDEAGAEFLDPSDKRTICPHKGEATYYHISSNEGVIENAAWSYETPVDGAETIKGYLAFDTGKVTVERL